MAHTEKPIGFATIIGDDVTIGHGAIIHACSIGNACLIGMGAIVLDGAVLENNSFVGAGAVIPPGKQSAAVNYGLAIQPNARVN